VVCSGIFFVFLVFDKLICFKFLVFFFLSLNIDILYIIFISINILFTHIKLKESATDKKFKK